MNAVQRTHRSLVPKGVLLDLQPTLTNAPVLNSSGILGRLNEREFRGSADRVNSLLEETIWAGLFVQESEVVLTVVHRFGDAVELVKEVKTWTDTTIPPTLLRRMKRSVPPFDHEDARLRRLRVL